METTCPNPTCDLGLKNQPPAQIIRHSLLRTRKGPTPRWRCKRCRRTFTARTGTAYHRLRTRPARFDRAVQMTVEGMSKAAAARVSQVTTGTLNRWLERAANGAASLCDEAVRELETSELQGDELRGFLGDKQHRAYVYASMEVGSRLWVSTVVGRRTLRNTRLFVRDTRDRCARGQERILFVTDRFRYYRQELRKAWNFACLHVELKKKIVEGRVVRTDFEITNGVQWQLDDALERCEVSKKPNTSYIERLNLFMRRALAYLHRRTTSIAKSREKLEEAVVLLQCYYNFVRPHGALLHRGVKKPRTPAMEAKITTRVVSLREIFMSFGVASRRTWLADPQTRRSFNRRWACAGSNS